ncbi:hypothetical protein [Kurthia sp. Dielmo]|uniref:hypothetical protein n=1 Tax=Kurthia sp. Dielmo TaxID=1033738 RepID=UPI001121087F|nr:hypothetical protein [Kurthia sp. Dielmo]
MKFSNKAPKTEAFYRSASVSPVIIAKQHVRVIVPATSLTRDGGIPTRLRPIVASIDGGVTVAEAINFNERYGLELGVQA